MIGDQFRPIRRSGYRIEPHNDAYIIRSDYDVVFPCNEIGALIWELADGQRRIGELIDLLSPVYSAQSPDLGTEVASAVGHFIDIGLMQPDPSSLPNTLLQLKWIGRFGNRMFTYAFGCHWARKFGCTYWMPSLWEGSRLFEIPTDINVRVVPDVDLRAALARVGPKDDATSARLAAVTEFAERTGQALRYVRIVDRENYGSKNICFENLCMYTDWIFAEYRREELKSFFQFTEEVRNSDLYRYYESRKGTYAIAHLRRGDIARQQYKGAHSVVDISSYFKAFEQYGVDPATVEWISDSPLDAAIRGSAHRQGSWTFPEGARFEPGLFFEFFPDFLKLVFAGTIFRANSAFSWWGACLSDARIYSPVLSRRKTYAQHGAMQCDFVEGNHPHFMGSREEGFCDIRLAGDSPGNP